MPDLHLLLPALILLLAVPKLRLKLGLPFFLILGLHLLVANKAISHFFFFNDWMVDLCTYIVTPKKMANAAMISAKSSLARAISF